MSENSNPPNQRPFSS